MPAPGPSRAVSLVRLQELSKPRPRCTSPSGSERAAAAAKPRPPSGGPGPGALMRSSSVPAPPRPRGAADAPPAPTEVPQPGSRARLGLAALELKRKRLKLLQQPQEVPQEVQKGLRRLLDRAFEEPPQAGSSQTASPRETSGLPSWRAGEGDGEESGLGPSGKAPPRPKRSFKAQRDYTQAHLYRLPPAPPGSVAALQLKLEALLQENRQRELERATLAPVELTKGAQRRQRPRQRQRAGGVPPPSTNDIE